MNGNTTARTSDSSIRLRRYTRAILTSWTAAIAIVLTWEVADERNQAVAIALSEAVGAWKKELAVLQWAAQTGTVYVPVTDTTRPDPNLSYLPETEISTPTSRKLTMVSPPMIMNQIHELDRKQSEVPGHITSLKPIRRQDAPDAWEKHALERFAAGETECYGEETIDGHRYMRFMRPLVVDKSCLACHAEQGYKVGDLRGGLSVAVPMASVLGTHVSHIFHRIAGYGGMWLLGLFGISVMSRRLRFQIERRAEAELALEEAHNLLEQRVIERTAELAEANGKLENEIADRRQAEQWLLESEQRFRGYFDQGLVGMAILSAQRQWVEVNVRLCRMLDYPEDELLLRHWQDLIYSDDQPTVETEFQRLLGGIVRGFVTHARLVRRDGRIFHAGLSAQCLLKPDGTVDCLLVLVQDMSRLHPA